MSKIWGVRIDNLTRKEILERVRFFLQGNKTRQIATINPEFILKAREDKKFRRVLNDCDLNVADGTGIRLAFWKNGEKLKAVFPGIDLMKEILKIADKEKISVFLATNRSGLSDWQETAVAIKKIYPNLNIGGKNYNPNFFPRSMKELAVLKNYEIIFVNFGAPWQEKFIAELKKRKIDFRLAMGVGGSFDFLTKKIRRAPQIIRMFGLEWLWRLLQQPKRFKKIFRAVVIFSIRIILNK